MPNRHMISSERAPPSAVERERPSSLRRPAWPGNAMNASHDSPRERHQDLRQQRRRRARRQLRRPEGRVRLPRRPVGLGQEHAAAAAQPSGPARAGRGVGGRAQHHRPAAGPGAPAAPQHRQHLPGLQAAAEQDGVRERGLRPGGHRQAQARHPPAGSGRARPRRPRRQGGALPAPALRRRAAARVDRQGVRQPAADPARRRADGEPRPDDGRGDHATARPDQQDRDDGAHGHPRPAHRQHDAQAGDPARPRRHRPRPGAAGCTSRCSPAWPTRSGRRGRASGAT